MKLPQLRLLMRLLLVHFCKQVVESHSEVVVLEQKFYMFLLICCLSVFRGKGQHDPTLSHLLIHLKFQQPVSLLLCKNYQRQWGDVCWIHSIFSSNTVHPHWTTTPAEKTSSQSDACEWFNIGPVRACSGGNEENASVIRSERGWRQVITLLLLRLNEVT